MPNNLIVEGGTKYICGKGHCFMQGEDHCMRGNIIVGGTIQDFLDHLLKMFFKYYIEKVNKILAITDQQEMDENTAKLYKERNIVFAPIYNTIIQNGQKRYVDSIKKNRKSFVDIIKIFIEALLRVDLMKKRPKSLQNSIMGNKGYQLIGDILANTTNLKGKVERIYETLLKQVNENAQQYVLLNEIKFLLYYLKVNFQDRGFIRAALQFDRIVAIEEEDEEDDEPEEEPQQTTSVGGSKIYKINFTKL